MCPYNLQKHAESAPGSSPIFWEMKGPVRLFGVITKYFPNKPSSRTMQKIKSYLK